MSRPDRNVGPTVLAYPGPPMKIRASCESRRARPFSVASGTPGTMVTRGSWPKVTRSTPSVPRNRAPTLRHERDGDGPGAGGRRHAHAAAAAPGHGLEQLPRRAANPLELRIHESVGQLAFELRVQGDGPIRLAQRQRP